MPLKISNVAALAHRCRIFLAVFIVIFLSDQISKWFILTRIFNGESPGFIQWVIDAPGRVSYQRLELLPFFNLTMVWNDGISFGMLSGTSAWQPYILSLMSVLICIALFIWMLKTQKKSQIIALSAVISGAMGNVFDRLRFGGVADFFDFHVLGWHYPAFNIADSTIVLGVAYLAIDAVFFSQSETAYDSKTND